MGLDVYLMVTKPVSVYDDNITHNLGEMARNVILNDDKVDETELNLYDVLWRPDEQDFRYACEIVEYLHTGWRKLFANPEKYKQYNPENGWGSYEGLLEFVKKYHEACLENPDAELRVSR